MNKEYVKYTILFLVLLNVLLLYKTNSNKIEYYESLNEENIALTKEIKESTSDDVKLENIYSSDKEFIDDMEELIVNKEIEDYKIIFEDNNLDDNNIMSKVLLQFVGNQSSIISLIDDLDKTNKLNIISIELKSTDELINGEISLDIKSNFDIYFKAEKDLFNKTPFRKESNESKDLDGIIINTEDEKETKEKMIESKEVKEVVKLDNNRGDKNKIEATHKENYIPKKSNAPKSTVDISKFKLKNIEFLKNEYENIEEIDEGLYLYSFNKPKNNIKYIGDSINISKLEEGRIVIEFWINTTFDNLEVGIEKKYKDSKMENKQFYNKTKCNEGWNHVNFMIEDRNIDSIRILFKLPNSSKRGSVLVNKIVIWEVDYYE